MRKLISIVVSFLLSSSLCLCQDTTILHKTKKSVVFAEQMPEFLGGKDSLNLFLRNNIKYPNKALELEIEGTVIVNFLLNEDGKISQAKVSNGIGGGCDEEALRVIKIMPKWKPARLSGIAVPIYYLLPVNFKIE
jgi:protein TonB